MLDLETKWTVDDYNQNRQIYKEASEKKEGGRRSKEAHREASNMQLHIGDNAPMILSSEQRTQRHGQIQILVRSQPQGAGSGMV